MGRFASTADRYEHLRQPYSPAFFRTVAERLGLSKRSALIDLGTGPAVLAIGFAPYVGRITGVDPEPAMLAAAREAVARSGYAATLIQGRAEDLPASIGSFDVVTIGRALHWMDRDALGPLFARLVAPGGAVVICASVTAPDDSNPWLETYNTARRHWSDPAMWPDVGHGAKIHRDLDTVLDGTGFRVTDKVRVAATHEISVSDLAERVLTFSPSSPDALGDKVEAMLADVEAKLAPFSRDGRLTEALLSVADIVRR
jgi:ubiquinone/menaquinone biosynthesis C-methylase UbiE